MVVDLASGNLTCGKGSVQQESKLYAVQWEQCGGHIWVAGDSSVFIYCNLMACCLGPQVLENFKCGMLIQQLTLGILV